MEKYLYTAENVDPISLFAASNTQSPLLLKQLSMLMAKFITKGAKTKIEWLYLITCNL
jgi:hypothetical protein